MHVHIIYIYIYIIVDVCVYILVCMGYICLYLYIYYMYIYRIVFRGAFSSLSFVVECLCVKHAQEGAQQVINTAYRPWTVMNTLMC